MVRQTSKWGQIFLLTLVTLGAATIATAYIYKIDEVITVNGKLVPKQGGIEIKSPISGKLEEIEVKNGEEVKKGQLLMKFNVKEAKSKTQTIKTIINIESKKQVDKEKSLLVRKNSINRNITLSKKILDKLKPLMAKGAISELQILNQKNKLETEQDSLEQIRNQEIILKGEYLARKASLEGELKVLDIAIENEKIYAPRGGRIFNLKPTHKNYIARETDTLLEIIPMGSLGGAVSIGNRDIGFIHKGQQVKVRVDSFPFTEYGEIISLIGNIGADALPPNELVREYHFPVTLELSKSYLETREGNKIPLQAGMTITGNLKLRERRLIEILSDIFVNRGESLERLRQP